ncbi:hypothetical protein [Acidovorax facilis]|uniref:hypothetical protein n=1 Tax=Acidovorax facilis TaxID=12917 RepID=UPI003D64F75C
MSSHWIVTADGMPHYLSGYDMAQNKYSIEVIAHAGAQINRFTGHCIRPYSVVEHQLLCADIAAHLMLPAVVQLACLMHDAHEVYVGDCSSPVKWELGSAWERLESPQANAVRRHFGLMGIFLSHRAQIKAIDLMALATERRDLVIYTEGISAPWAILDTPGRKVEPAHWVQLHTAARAQRSWTDWAQLYLERFHQLRDAINATLATNIQSVTEGIKQ